MLYFIRKRIFLIFILLLLLHFNILFAANKSITFKFDSSDVKITKNNGYDIISGVMVILGG